MKTGYEEKVLYNRGGEAPEQAAERRGWCLVPGDIQGQADPH